MVIGSLLSGCSLLSQQTENNCPLVDVVELPVVEQACPKPQIIERIITKTVTAPLRLWLALRASYICQ